MHFSHYLTGLSDVITSVMPHFGDNLKGLRTFAAPVLYLHTMFNVYRWSNATIPQMAETRGMTEDV